MSDEPETPLDLASIKLDLERSFLPVWAKESEMPERQSHWRDEGRLHEGGERRRPGRFGRERRPGPRQGEGRRPPRGDHRHVAPREREEVRQPAIRGWDARFKPDLRGVEGVAKHIKGGAKAYRLFDLAWLVLEKAERYRIELRRTSADATALFQLRIDGSVWLSEREAIAHALGKYIDKFYRKERVATDPPKGVYPFVGVCGMSGVILGPPNYHDYQTKVRRLHAERFSSIPFEVYKNRIRIDRDEASIQKWKEEQSSKDEFYPVVEEGAPEPPMLGSFAETERHFLEHHAVKCVSRIVERALVPGSVALVDCAAAIVHFVRDSVDELRHFPLPLAHTLGQQLKSKGLHIFKAHQNVTYVSVAQPRYLDRKAMPVAEGVNAILEYLETHASTPRAEQWKELVALRSTPVGATDAERESALAADLLWLLREGHVIDFARRGLEVAPRPKAPPAARPERPRHRTKAKSTERKAGPVLGDQPAVQAPAASVADAPAETPNTQDTESPSEQV